MAYQVLARKWRPKKFADLVGQEHVVKALQNALANGRLHHAYLLTGTRGVGKTTIARILAKSLNCETPNAGEPCGVCASCSAIDAGRFVDLLEIDAASNTGIDNIREVLENAQYAPTAGRYKVYIIDEVHMLSKSAFNAMLKTLEEPPEHVKFILATTDPHKVPITVLSRCLQFVLRNMTAEQVAGHLAHVLQAENIAYETPALQLLGRAAAGSMRDALSLLDQAIALGSGSVKEQEVRQMMGAVDKRHLYELLSALASQNPAAMLAQAQHMAANGVGFDNALAELAVLLQQLALLQILPNALAHDDPEYAQLHDLTKQFNGEQIQLYYQCVLHGRQDLPLAPDEYAGFVMTLLRMLAFTPLAAAHTPEHGIITGSDLQHSETTTKKSPALEANAAVPAPSALAASQPSSGQVIETQAHTGYKVADLPAPSEESMLAAHLADNEATQQSSTTIHALQRPPEAPSRSSHDVGHRPPEAQDAAATSDNPPWAADDVATAAQSHQLAVQNESEAGWDVAYHPMSSDSAANRPPEAAEPDNPSWPHDDAAMLLPAAASLSHDDDMAAGDVPALTATASAAVANRPPEACATIAASSHSLKVAGARAHDDGIRSPEADAAAADLLWPEGQAFVLIAADDAAPDGNRPPEDGLAAADSTVGFDAVDSDALAIAVSQDECGAGQAASNADVARVWSDADVLADSHAVLPRDAAVSPHRPPEGQLDDALQNNQPVQMVAAGDEAEIKVNAQQAKVGKNEADDIRPPEAVEMAMPLSLPPLSAENWAAIVAQLLADADSGGRLWLRQTAVANWQADAGELTLAVQDDSGLYHHRNEAQKCAQALSRHYGRAIRIQTCAWQDGRGWRTPKMHHDAQQQQARDEVQRVLEADAAAQDVLALFGATWLPDTLVWHEVKA